MPTRNRSIENMRAAAGNRPVAAGAAALQMMDALPVAVYRCDARRRIVHHNEAAAALWGRRPAMVKDLWCGSLKMYQSDGRALAHELSPMTQALLMGGAIDESDLLIWNARMQPGCMYRRMCGRCWTPPAC